MTIKSTFTRIVKPFLEFDKTDKFSASPAPGSHKWTDIIDDAVWDSVFNALDEHARLVLSDLYYENEYLTLCSFTHTFSCDYEGRFQWCKQNRMIEYRCRSPWSCFWYDSPVDHILTVYMPNELNIKGYKDGKHVLEEHIQCNSWAEYKDKVTDKYHLKDENPKFIGRRWDGTHEWERFSCGNWIAEGNGVAKTATAWILEDEPLVKMLK